MFHVKHLCFLFNSTPKHMYGSFVLTYSCENPIYAFISYQQSYPHPFDNCTPISTTLPHLPVLSPLACDNYTSI